jgi:hypothetical protein
LSKSEKLGIVFSEAFKNTDISNNVYLNYDTNSFKAETSNNLSLSDTFWEKKDVIHNLFFNSGKIGIQVGVRSPGANYALDVLTNINCAEICRNGTPICSTLSIVLP